MENMKITIEHIRKTEKSYTGYFKLSDRTKTSFSIDLVNGWQQWGNTKDNLGVTCSRLDELQQELHSISKPKREDNKMTVKSYIKEHANSERELDFFLTKCGNYLSQKLENGEADDLKLTVDNGSLCVCFKENKCSDGSDNWISF